MLTPQEGSIVHEKLAKTKVSCLHLHLEIVVEKIIRTIFSQHSLITIINLSLFFYYSRCLHTSRFDDLTTCSPILKHPFSAFSRRNNRQCLRRNSPLLCYQYLQTPPPQPQPPHWSQISLQHPQQQRHR